MWSKCKSFEKFPAWETWTEEDQMKGFKESKKCYLVSSSYLPKAMAMTMAGATRETTTTTPKTTRINWLVWYTRRLICLQSGLWSSGGGVACQLNSNCRQGKWWCILHVRMLFRLAHPSWVVGPLSAYLHPSACCSSWASPKFATKRCWLTIFHRSPHRWMLLHSIRLHRKK